MRAHSKQLLAQCQGLLIMYAVTAHGKCWVPRNLHSPCAGHGGIRGIMDDMTLLSTEAEGVNDTIPVSAVCPCKAPASIMLAYIPVTHVNCRL